MDKIIDYHDLPKEIKKIKIQGSLVLVGGVFDVLHRGHMEFLKEAKKQGDTLLVMLESDESVRQKKGDGRPIHNQKVRASILASLTSVDYILLLPYFKTDNEYYNLVKTLEPDIIAVSASDEAVSKKSEQAKMVGGKVVEVIERLPYSTTELIER